MARQPSSTPSGSTRHRTKGALDAQQLKTVDTAVGAQVRLRRILLGLSQEAVSNIIGLTFQQLQKYEHGTNRISASRLYQLAAILQVPVSYFFETVDIEPANEPKPASRRMVAAADNDAMPGDLMKKRKTVEVVRAFYGIDDVRQRNAVLSLMKSLARPGGH